MTGFFPIMMFALPAAALAIWHEAKPVQKKAVGGIMLLGRAVLVPDRRDRAARVRVHVRRLAAVLHPRGPHRHLDGPGQRARHQGRLRVLGAACSTTCSTRTSRRSPLWLILIGIGYAVLYYFLFRFVIRKWNLRTPGREEEGEESHRRLGGQSP